MKMLSVVLALAMVVPLLSGLALATDTDIQVTTGETDKLGGGKYVAVNAGDSVEFGVIYGTSDNPNSVLIYTKHHSYVGDVTVKNDKGQVMGTRPAYINTILVQKLYDIIEFSDDNGNGICDVGFSADGMSYNDYTSYEKIYKSVSLNTSWTMSNLVEENDGDLYKIDFSLTAENLSYTASPLKDVFNTPIYYEENQSNDVLEKVQFTFHIKVNKSTGNVTMNRYTVTVSREDNQIVKSVEKTGVENYNATLMNYSMKYDHTIEGWDYNPENKHPGLMLNFKLLLAREIPVNRFTWMHENMLNKMNSEAGVVVNTSAGEERMNVENAPTTMDATRPVKIVKNAIEAGTAWHKTDRLQWTSNVTVDGNGTVMKAQMQNAVRVMFRFGTHAFTGLLLPGGFTYPGGQTIVHDPEISSQVAYVDSEESAGGLYTFLSPGILVAVVVIAAAVLITALLVASKKKESYADYYDVVDDKKSR